MLQFLPASGNQQIDNTYAQKYWETSIDSMTSLSLFLYEQILTAICPAEHY